MTIWAVLLPLAMAVTVVWSAVIVIARAGRDVAATAAATRKQQHKQQQPQWARTTSVPPWQKGRHP